MRYRIGRRLVGDRTTKTRLEAIKITELKFADDATICSN